MVVRVLTLFGRWWDLRAALSCRWRCGRTFSRCLLLARHTFDATRLRQRLVAIQFALIMTFCMPLQEVGCRRRRVDGNSQTSPRPASIAMWQVLQALTSHKAPWAAVALEYRSRLVCKMLPYSSGISTGCIGVPQAGSARRRTDGSICVDWKEDRQEVVGVSDRPGRRKTCLKNVDTTHCTGLGSPEVVTPHKRLVASWMITNELLRFLFDRRCRRHFPTL